MSAFVNSVGKIECLDKDGKTLSQGSGFFYRIPTGRLSFSNYDQSLLCFITSKHVLDDDPYQYKITIRSIADIINPTTEILIFNLNEVIVVEHPEEDLAMLHIKSADLKASNGYEIPNFLKYEKYEKHIKHPVVSEYFNYFYNTVPISTKFQIQNNQLVYIPGYHLGRDIHKFNAPINVIGYFVSDLTKNVFVIQAPVNFGSSGCPIFIPYTDVNNNLQFYLFGIVSEAVSEEGSSFTGLLYGISSWHIYLLEQLLVAKISK